MNKWEAIVLVFLILILAFVFLAESNPLLLPQFTGYTVDLVVAVFGVGAIIIVVRFFSRK
jgi:hypothetical protein